MGSDFEFNFTIILYLFLIFISKYYYYELLIKVNNLKITVDLNNSVDYFQYYFPK